MTVFSFRDYVVPSEDLDLSRYTDLALSPDASVLYATHRYDGGIRAFQVSSGALIELAFVAHSSTPVSGSRPNIEYFGDGVLSGGGLNGELTFHELGNGGSFTTSRDLGPQTQFGGELFELTSTELSNGDTAIFAGIGGQAGIARLVFDQNNQLLESSIVADTSSAYADNTIAMAVGVVGATNVLITGSTTENGITLWTIQSDGSLLERASLGVGDGFWMSGPASIEIAEVSGRAFAVVAAHESNSLSVVEVFENGSLSVRDHIIDDLGTRFDAASKLTITQHGDRTYVFAAGADDGVSAFLITKNGRLLHLADIADGIDFGLTNISALAARSNGDQIDVFATSALEPGLTWLSFDAGPIGTTSEAASSGGNLSGTSGGDMLYGAAGADVMNGGDGNDVIIDGAGSDVLSGGAGRDLFVLDADNAVDRITDFDIEHDRIDLSAWPSLRSLNQIFWTTTADGIILTYGQETLEIATANSSPLDLADFNTASLIGPTRLPDTIQPGFAGPIVEPPALPPRIPYVPPVQPPPPEEGGLELLGTSAKDVLRGGDLGDSIFGLSNDDSLFGGGGNDIIDGGSGSDRILGEAGDDTLLGGTGRDLRWAGGTNSTSDTIQGGSGNDVIRGQSGPDRLDGGSGDDVLNGGDGRDTFVFTAGRDIIQDFDPAVDQLELDNSLWSGGLDTDGVLSRFGSTNDLGIVLAFNSEDSLQLLNISDLASLSASIDLI